MRASNKPTLTHRRLSMKQIRELKEASINLESIVSENLRETLFKKTVNYIFSLEAEEFDQEGVYR